MKVEEEWKHLKSGDIGKGLGLKQTDNCERKTDLERVRKSKLMEEHHYEKIQAYFDTGLDTYVVEEQ